MPQPGAEIIGAIPIQYFGILGLVLAVVAYFAAATDIILNYKKGETRPGHENAHWTEESAKCPAQALGPYQRLQAWLRVNRHKLALRLLAAFSLFPVALGLSTAIAIWERGTAEQSKFVQFDHLIAWLVLLTTISLVIPYWVFVYTSVRRFRRQLLILSTTSQSNPPQPSRRERVDS